MTYIVLSDQSLVKVPEGADPDFVRKVYEQRLANAANPKPKRRRSASQRTSKREQAYRTQAALTGMAMAEQVMRVNNNREDNAE